MQLFIPDAVMRCVGSQLLGSGNSRPALLPFFRKVLMLGEWEKRLWDEATNRKRKGCDVTDHHLQRESHGGKKKALVARADDCIFCAFSEDFGNQRGGYQACILCYLCLPLDAPVLYLQQTLSLVLLALFTGMPISAKLSA
jgi:hypothetical protein